MQRLLKSTPTCNEPFLAIQERVANPSREYPNNPRYVENTQKICDKIMTKNVFAVFGVSLPSRSAQILWCSLPCARRFNGATRGDRLWSNDSAPSNPRECHVKCCAYQEHRLRRGWSTPLRNLRSPHHIAAAHWPHLPFSKSLVKQIEHDELPAGCTAPQSSWRAKVTETTKATCFPRLSWWLQKSLDFKTNLAGSLKPLPLGHPETLEAAGSPPKGPQWHLQAG